MNEGMLRKESDDEESEDRNIDRRSSILYTEVCHLQHSPKPLKDYQISSKQIYFADRRIPSLICQAQFTTLCQLLVIPSERR
jgi:hypothetical protein